MSLVFHQFQDDSLPALTELWNASAANCHGFHPLAPEDFRRHFHEFPNFTPGRLLLAHAGGELVGMVHYDVVDMRPYYPRAGVVSAIMVRPGARGRGFGRALLNEALARLKKSGETLIDALGAWPYSSFYVGLIDGSERAGVDCADPVALGLFAKAGFRRGRESLIMRAPMAPIPGAASMAGAGAAPGAALGKEMGLPPRLAGTRAVCRSREGETTWLDVCFRRWRAYDHALVDEEGRELAQAIYARMDGYSEHCGRELYSVYGVNTPERWRRQGFAARNLRLMQARLASLGGQEMEVHVYADNLPAVRLYESVGFKPIGRAVIMRRDAAAPARGGVTP